MLLVEEETKGDGKGVNIRPFPVFVIVVSKNGMALSHHVKNVARNVNLVSWKESISHSDFETLGVGSGELGIGDW